MDEVATLRGFSRSFTRRIGLLDESYLESGRPLGPSRVLFELGPGPTRVVDLRRRLELDSGYLSRLLRQLESEGHITVGPDPADGRQRIARLTAKGRREWRRLDERSTEVARDLLEPLSARRRAELADALSTAERLLAVAGVQVSAADPRSAEARTAVGRYFDELAARFPSGFDASAAGAAADAEQLRPPDGVLLLMAADGAPVGCGGLQRIDDTTSEIKRMWIDPDWRGLGLGRRLLKALEAVARDGGRRRVVLDTNGTLVEAIAMYEGAGYSAIERYNDNPYAQRWFAKRL